MIGPGQHVVCTCLGTEGGSISQPGSGKGRWETRRYLQRLGQAPILHVVVGVLLLQRILHPREVVAVCSPAVFQPLLGLRKLCALRLSAHHVTVLRGLQVACEALLCSTE